MNELDEADIRISDLASLLHDLEAVMSTVHGEPGEENYFAECPECQIIGRLRKALR